MSDRAFYTVWAPLARTVRVVVDGAVHPMTVGADGWWHVDGIAATSDSDATSDYGYLLDDDPNPLPDPRSRWQPGGVDALSRAVPDPQAPSTFARSKLKWAEPLSGEHARLLSLYRSLARLRREHPDLTDPRFAGTTCEHDEDARWFVIRRGATVIAVNFSTALVTLPYVGTLLLATDDAVTITADALGLPGHTAAILA